MDIEWEPLEDADGGDLPEIIFEAQRWDPNGQPREPIGIAAANVLVGPDNRPPPPVQEWQLVDEDNALAHRQMVNPQEFEDYKCIFCLGVAVNPLIHVTSPQPGCPTILCSNCFERFLEASANQLCPYRCNRGELLRNGIGPLPLRGGRRNLATLNSLQVRCKYEACDVIVRYDELRNHVENCVHNPESNAPCENCGVPKRGHNCREYVRELESRIRSLNEKNDDLSTQVIDLMMERDAVREELAQARQDNRPRGMMNNLRCANQYRGSPHVIVRYGDRSRRFTDLDLGMRASELRSRIERHFCTELGSIIRVDYTVLGTHQTLRQHQVGHRPTFWIALPPGERVVDGQSIEVTLGANGPVV